LGPPLPHMPAPPHQRHPRSRAVCCMRSEIHRAIHVARFSTARISIIYPHVGVSRQQKRKKLKIAVMPSPAVTRPLGPLFLACRQPSAHDFYRFYRQSRIRFHPHSAPRFDETNPISVQPPAVSDPRPLIPDPRAEGAKSGETNPIPPPQPVSTCILPSQHIIIIHWSE
jgi:hypothetical protein